MIPADTEQYDFQPIHASDEHGLILFYRIRFGREYAPKNGRVFSLSNFGAKAS
ncbi:hypothetical protein VCHA30O60_70091 [Vibrio chagasii]|nr:hypothetical protein VCHA30O60_70091 [Vibrio chagasii]